MAIKKFHGWLVAAFAVAAAAASPAFALSTARFEYLKGDYVYSGTSVSSSGASVQTGAAPNFGGVAGKARITVTAGAVVITPAGANPTATETNGFRLEACMGSITLPVGTGQKFAIIESSAVSTCAGGGGGIANGADVATGNTADAAWTGTGSATVISILKRASNSLATPPTQAVTVSAGTAIMGKVQLDAPTTGGCTLGALQSAATTNATLIKNAAGTLCGGFAINTTSTLYYLRLYNLTTAPTCSSATGFVMSIPIPASTTGAGVVFNFGPYGGAFATGIGFCLTGGGSSTDNTSAATGVFVSYGFK